MTNKNVTMKDVALKANVSIKTVSNVINHKDDQMKPTTKSRVNKAIEQLGYRVNRSAQALKTGKTGILGFAMPDFDQPFESYLTNAISEAARKRGYAVVTSLFGFDQGRRNEFAKSMQKINADGWIFFLEEPVHLQSSLFSQHVPLVLISDYSTSGLYDRVTMANAEAARYLTCWLLDRGAQTIGFIGAPPSFFSNPALQDKEREQLVLNTMEGNAALRLQGFIQAIQSRNLATPWKFIIPTKNMTGLGGATATLDLLTKGSMPDALICVNDAVALGVISTLNKSGFSVPNEVQVCGFDGIPEGEFSFPPLTTIDPHIHQYAQLAVDALVNRIDGDTSAAGIYTSGFNLLTRGTTKSL